MADAPKEPDWNEWKKKYGGSDKEWQRFKRSRREWNQWFETTKEGAKAGDESDARVQRKHDETEADIQWIEAIHRATREELTEFIKNLEYVDDDDKDKSIAEKAVEDARRAARGGFFSAPNPRKAERIIKRNQGAIQRANAKGKKKRSWCSIFALVVLAGSVVEVAAIGSGALDLAQSLGWA